MRSFLLCACALSMALVAPAGLAAEIEKKAQLTDKGMNFYWWPKITPPAGWRHDEDQSVEMQSNVLVPKGKNFQNAEVVIYARAFYQPDKRKRGTLQQFIDEDIKNMLRNDAAIKVEEVGVIKTAGGKQLRAFGFVNAGKSYEQVCYGGEGDFWIEFVVSSQTQKGLARTLPVFKQILARYR